MTASKVRKLKENAKHDYPPTQYSLRNNGIYWEKEWKAGGEGEKRRLKPAGESLGQSVPGLSHCLTSASLSQPSAPSLCRP